MGMSLRLEQFEEGPLEPSATTPNANRFLCPTEWLIRRLRYSPGWRTEDKPQFEHYMVKPANCLEQCMTSATTPCMTKLLYLFPTLRQSWRSAEQPMDRKAPFE